MKDPGRRSAAVAHTIAPVEPTEDAIRAALSRVNDPEIHKPITELGMVKGIEVRASGVVEVGIYLTVAGCPMRNEIGSPQRSPTSPASVRCRSFWT